MSPLAPPNPKVVEFDYYIAPDGKEYYFADNRYRFLMSSGGHGMPPLRYIVERGPFQQGVTPLDYRLDPRVIQMLVRRQGTSRTNYWNNRADILNALRPNRQAANTFATGTLRKIFPNGMTRDLSVLIDRGPEFKLGNPNQWEEWDFEEVIRFIAFDPVFFDPDSVDITFALAAFNNLVFPVTFPIQFGSSTINEIVTVNYPGTWLTYPTITITGPLENPVITNTITGETIDLDYNVSSGQVITINLDYGEKTVEDNNGTNLIGSITDSSDLATFHVAPDPEAPNGDNTFQVQGSGAVVNETSVSISYFVRYLGI